MLDPESSKGSNDLLKLLNKDNLDNTDENPYMSVDEFEQLIYNFSEPTLCQSSAEQLITYFSHNPYIYSDTYIKAFFEFYDKNNNKTKETIDLVTHILISLFCYDEQNIYVLKTMENEKFYCLLWQYIDTIPSVMVLYKWLIKTFDSAFNFAIKNGIIEILSILIYPESEQTIQIFDFFSSFARYTDFYSEFINLLNSICDLTFSTFHDEVFSAGMGCIGEFARRHTEIALHIFRNNKFYYFCNLLSPERPDTLRVIIEFINRTLHNIRIQNSIGHLSGCLGSLLTQETDIEIKISLLHAIEISLTMNSNNIQESNNLFYISLKILSSLINDHQMTKLCMQKKIHEFIFKMIHTDCSFLVITELVRVLCTLVSTADLECTRELINMGFLTTLSNLNDLFIKIPSIIVISLMHIISFSQSFQEFHQWKQEISENENIIEQLHFIIDHSDEIDEDDYQASIEYNTQILLQSIES